MKRILDDENENDGDDASVDIEGVTRDIGKLREEANGTGKGWDTELEFTARSMDLNQSPRLKTTGIPSRIEEIMAEERSFGEDDDEEEEDEEANAVEVQEKPVRRKKFADELETRKVSQTAEDENALKDAARAKSQEKIDRLRRELKERREERRPITSYESDDNKIPQERQEGVLRQTLPRKRRSQSGDFSKKDPVHVDLPVRNMHNNKENIKPEEEKPLSRLERRYQGEDGLKAIQRAREHRTRDNHDYNHKFPENTELRSSTENSHGAPENTELQPLERAETNEEIEDIHEKTSLEEEQDRTRGNPTTIYSGNERRSNGANSKQADSLQILRNLSRTITSTNGTGRNNSGQSDNDLEVRMASERSPFELEQASKKFPNAAPSPPPSAPIDPLLLPTPRVTGAWIETPAPPRMRTNGQTPKVQPKIEEEPSSPGIKSEPSEPSQSHSRTRPTPINSAPTVSAAADLQRIEKEARLDDSTTIDRDFSLIMKNQYTSPPAPEPIEINLDFDEKGQPLSQKEKEKRMEEVAFQRMSRSLRNTSSSIRDARHGIERLEQQVASSGSHYYSPQELGIPTPKTSSRPFFLDVPPNPALNPNVHYLMIPLPRIRNPATKKFTWFGLLFTIFMTWFVTEWAMCETYCHPKYSNKDVWHPSDPFWPWAIPTKLNQWTGKVVSDRMEDVYDWWYGYDEQIRIWKEQTQRQREQEDLAHRIKEIGNDEVVEEDEILVDERSDAGGKGKGSWWSWDNDKAS